MTENRQKTAATAVKNAALVLSGVLLSLLLLEVFLRLAGFMLLYGQQYSNRQKIENKGNCVVLCLGESTTFGQYPRLLEKMLNERSGKLSFRVIDKGRSATDTAAIISSLESDIKEFNPDIIVAMMGINDDGKLIPYAKDTFLSRFRTYRLLKLIEAHVAAKFSGINKGMTAAPEPTGKTQPAVPPGARDNKKRSADTDPYLSLCESTFWSEHPTGNFNRTKKLIDKAQSLFTDPGDVYERMSWGFRFIYKNEFEKPIKYYSYLVKTRPNSWWYKCLGDTYILAGELDKAEDIYKKGYEIFGDDEKLGGSLAMLYHKMGKDSVAGSYSSRAGESLKNSYKSETRENYAKLEKAARKHGIRLFLMQYPLRNADLLKKIAAEDADGVTFVSNELNFKQALRTSTYDDLFWDNFAGDFGHCTDEGNRLIAENLAGAILKAGYTGRGK